MLISSDEIKFLRSAWNILHWVIMSAKASKLGYSSDVRMELNVNGFVLPIGQLGPDFLILRASADHPPAEAEIVMWIDGDESRWNVQLPDGISTDKSRTRIG